MDHAKESLGEGEAAKFAQADAKESRGEVSFASAKRSEPDWVLVGEAARMLGVSHSTVQRMCQEWEENPKADPRPGLPFAWSRPGTGRRDVYGKPIQGRRRIPRAAVAAEVRERARQAARVAAALRRIDPAQ